MSAPTPAHAAAEGRDLQPLAFGRPSPGLIARGDHGYAPFLAQADPDDRTGDHDPGAARHR